MIVAQRSWKIILAAIFGGFVLGIVARLWMRWISTDPEFSWSGTIFIIMAFTFFTTTQALVYVFRRRVVTRRLTSVVRSVGIFFTLVNPAVAVMFATVALASLALWQEKMDKRGRISLLIISLIMPVRQIIEIGSDFGWNVPTLGRSLLFILIYTLVIFLLKPTFTPYVDVDSNRVPMSRDKGTLLVVLIVLFAFLYHFITMGVSGF